MQGEALGDDSGDEDENEESRRRSQEEAPDPEESKGTWRRLTSETWGRWPYATCWVDPGENRPGASHHPLAEEILLQILRHAGSRYSREIEGTDLGPIQCPGTLPDSRWGLD